MRELLSELMTAIEAGRECVFCALVETRGSTPQKAGAAMLVFADGSQRGTLGGGCVEAEVKQRALRLIGRTADSSVDSSPQLLTFHLDDNYGWDDGLICGGRMGIVAQPLQRGQRVHEYFRRFHELVHGGTGCTEAVAIADVNGTQVGTRFLFDAAGRVAARLHSESIPEEVAEQLVPVQSRPRAYHHHGVAYLPVLPRVRLLIVGGGHVGQAVGKLAADADFDVWVLDDREQYASAERFPQAQQRIVGDIGQELKKLGPQVGRSDYAIIVTRGHSHDEEALLHLAATRAGYVGMIGSKRKIKLIFDDLLAKGVPAEALNRVHAPLGLDIGSQTVPEIAVSIVAELIACRNLGVTRVDLRRNGVLNPVAP
jgi:xanthine dehydrogenase accessory factor